MRFDPALTVYSLRRSVRSRRRKIIALRSEHDAKPARRGEVETVKPVFVAFDCRLRGEAAGHRLRLSARPCQPPIWPRLSVATLPSTGSMAKPPSTAMYRVAPFLSEPTRTIWPRRTRMLRIGVDRLAALGVRARPEFRSPRRRRRTKAARHRHRRQSLGRHKPPPAHRYCPGCRRANWRRETPPDRARRRRETPKPLEAVAAEVLNGRRQARRYDAQRRRHATAPTNSLTGSSRRTPSRRPGDQRVVFTRRHRHERHLVRRRQQRSGHAPGPTAESDSVR